MERINLLLLCKHQPSEVAHIGLQLTTHLSTSKGWKGYVGLVGWPSSGRFIHISGHPSTAGRAWDRESSPVTDRRSTTVPRNQPLGRVYAMHARRYIIAVYRRRGIFNDLSLSSGSSFIGMCRHTASTSTSTTSFSWETSPGHVLLSTTSLLPREMSWSGWDGLLQRSFDITDTLPSPTYGHSPSSFGRY